MSTNEDYLALLSDLIKKQMIMLGPQIAISKARKVQALTVDNSGQVTAITGDAQLALKELANAFMTLSGQIATTTLESLLEKYPDIKAQQT